MENHNAPCMENGNCTKRYPRHFSNETSADQDGYPFYRRRDNGKFFVDTKGRRVDNRWIVPHNVFQTSKYNAHINVEVCLS